MTTINNRTLTSFQPVADELLMDKQKNYLFDVSHLGIIDVVGEKSLDFLQGQLTCDLRRVSGTQMVQGIQCNLKGRILSLLDIVDWQGVKLMLPQDLIEATLLSFNKTALLSRVSLQENSEYCLLGLYLQNINDLLPETNHFSSELNAFMQTSSFCYYHLGANFYLFILPRTMKDAFCKPFKEKNQLCGALTWHTLALMHQRIAIYPESRGLFLPHRLGFHETQYISFNKGCYKGQEIIARTQYKATIKHQLNTFVTDAAFTPFSGQKLFKCNEPVEVGEVVDFSYLDADRVIIAASILKETSLKLRFEGHDAEIELALFEN